MTLEQQLEFSKHLSLDEIHRNELPVTYEKLCEIVEELELQVEILDNRLNADRG